MVPQCSLTIRTSVGTAIYYYGNLTPYGGIMNVTLDGRSTMVDTRLPSLPEYRSSLVWSQAGLDGTLQHVLIVTMVSGDFIDVDRVDVTVPQASSSLLPASLSNTAGNPTSTTTVTAGQTRNPTGSFIQSTGGSTLPFAATQTVFIPGQSQSPASGTSSNT